MKLVMGPFPIVSLALLAAAFGGAQDAPPRDTGLTIRQSVQEVLLDVTVRDAKGKVIKNLKPGDLQVFEDGVRQDVKSFKLILGREPETKGKGAATVAATAPAPSSTMGSPLRSVNLICIVYVNLDSITKQYAIHATQDFLRNQMQPEDWIAVFNLGQTLTALQPFTTNKAEVMNAANNAFVGTSADFAHAATAVLNSTPNVMTIQVSGTTATMSITGGELNTQVITGADIATGPAANQQRGDQADARRQFGGIEGMRQMDQVLAMIRQLGTLPGRKSVLLMSPGLSTIGDPDMFKSMLDKANKANVTVYGVDVNGLSAELDQTQASTSQLKHAAAVSSTQSAMGGNAAQNMEKMRQGDYVNDAVRTSDTQASLRALSEGTGGFLIGNTNDLRKSFAKIIDDVDTHYEVIYHPASDKYDGRLRTIDVKTARADLSVTSRTGYFALPALGSSTQPAPYEMAGLAALSVAQPPHAFAFQSSAFQFRPSLAATQNDLVFEIPVSNLRATSEGALHRSRLHIALLALVKDSTGQVVDKFSLDSPYEIPDENLAKARMTSITFTHPLSLPPGHYSLETAALDEEAGHASTNKFEFDSPELKGVGLSSIMLVQNTEQFKGKVEAADPLQFQPDPAMGKKIVPELATSLASNATPSVFFVVYPDSSIADKPKIQAEFLVGGQVLAKQVADLPPADSTGAIPMVISTAAKTGNCELRITAMQGKTSSVQSLKYSIAAK